MTALRIEDLKGVTNHRAIIDTHLAGKNGGPLYDFDRMPRIFMNAKGAEREQFRAMVRLGYTALAIMLGGKDAIYPAGAITKGYAGNYHSVLSGLDSITDLGERIPRLYREAILPANKQHMLSFIGTAARLWPEQVQVPPALLEGAFALVGREPEFAREAKLWDNVFMSVWIPLIANNINLLPIQGDQYFSRSTHLEIGEAVSKAAGLRPKDGKPNNGIRIVDVNKDPVSLLQIMRGRLEYLLYAADHKLILDVEPTELARDLDIFERFERGDLLHVNPEFAQGMAENRKAIREFADKVRPFLLEGVARGRFHITTDGLTNTKFTRALAAAELKRKTEPDMGPFSSRLKGFNFVPITEPTRHAHAHIGQYTQDDLKFPQVDMPAHTLSREIQSPIVDLYLGSSFYESIAGQTLFEENVFSQLATHGDVAHRALLQIRFLLGAMDSVVSQRSPANVTYFAASQDTGPESRALLRRYNKDAVVKLGGTEALIAAPGVNFENDVRRPLSNWIAEKVHARRSKGARVFSPLDFAQIFQNLETVPQLVVAHGEPAPAGRVETMLRQAWLRRHVTDFEFVKGRWEDDSNLVQDMVLATKMQLGLVAGAGPSSHNVAVLVGGEEASLYDRILPLWEQLKKVEGGKTSPLIKEQRTALLQLCALGEMLQQHQERTRVLGAMREAGLHAPQDDLPWQNIPISLRKDLGAFEKLWTEIRQVVADDAYFALDVRATHFDLMPQLKGVNAVITQHRARQGLYRGGATQHAVLVGGASDGPK